MTDSLLKKGILKIGQIVVILPIMLSALYAQSAYHGGEGDGHAMAEVSDVSLSVSEPGKLQLNLFPNPVTTDEVTVKLEKTHQNIHYRMVNLTGQTVIQKTKSHVQTLRIDMNRLPPGTYGLLIRTDRQRHRTKVVKLD